MAFKKKELSVWIIFMFDLIEGFWLYSSFSV